MVAFGVEAPLVVGTLCLVVGSLSYLDDRDQQARVSAVVGFVFLALVLVVLTDSYVDRSDRYIMPFVALAGVVVCLQAAWLVSKRWHRAHQLVTATTVVLVLLVPFELRPSLLLSIQEILADQVATLMGWLGYQVTIEAASTGAMTELRFENNGFYNIARECTGVDGFALLAGLVAAAQATWRMKAVAVAVLAVAVYAVNMVRMVFVAAAISGDWFGPYVTSDDTVQMTYYIAEYAMGLTFVILATIVFFLYLSRFMPDLRAFVMELFETLTDPFALRGTHDLQVEQ